MESWEAVNIKHVVPDGRTNPLVVECAGPLPGRAERRRFLVKALGQPEVTNTGLFCEVFANAVARMLGVNTPEPALIRLTDDFLQRNTHSTQSAPELHARLQCLSPGICAGCEYLAALTELGCSTELPKRDMEQALRIYAFDLMVQNADRRAAGVNGPNCGYVNNRLFAIDFEMCFSFLQMIGNNVKPWMVSELSINTQHVFYVPLRTASSKAKVDPRVDFRPFATDVAALDLESLARNMLDLPKEWVTSASLVLKHLAAVVANVKEFELELYGSLA